MCVGVFDSMHRVLRPTPSDASHLSAWQLEVREEIQKIHQEAFEKRMPIVKIIQSLAQPDATDALRDVALAVGMANGCSENEAEVVVARSILKAGSSNEHGSRTTCILQWRFDDDSLWRGPSDNKKVARLARSMACSGFHEDEPICARTFDLSASPNDLVVNRLMFGDGQARGLAAKLVWHLILNHLRSASNTSPAMPCVGLIIRSLIHIPTVFEHIGNNTMEDLLVGQAARQNVKATMALPMNTVEWAGLVLRCSGFQLGASLQNTGEILKCLERCTQKFDEHIDVKAFDMEPVAKRSRKGRRKPTAGAITGPGTNPNEEDQDRLKIGHRRVKAIRAILEGCVQDTFKLLQMHLVWAGDYSYCALSDETLALPWLWPKSLPPPDCIPNEAQMAQRDAAARVSQDMIPSHFSTAPMQYEEALTAQQHKMILEKALNIYEDEALHLDVLSMRVKLRPKEEDWKVYRMVVQQWDTSINQCCMRDLDAADYLEMEKAILYGDAMDAQIMRICTRWPKVFHVGMLPDIASELRATPRDQAEQDVFEASLVGLACCL